MTNMLYILNSQIVDIFSKGYMEKVARKTKFVRRISLLNAEKFIAMCVFFNDDIYKDSLQVLADKLNANEGISI